MIKQLTLAILLFAPFALLPTNRLGDVSTTQPVDRLATSMQPLPQTISSSLTERKEECKESVEPTLDPQPFDYFSFTEARLSKGLQKLITQENISKESAVQGGIDALIQNIYSIAEENFFMQGTARLFNAIDNLSCDEVSNLLMTEKIPLTHINEPDGRPVLARAAELFTKEDMQELKTKLSQLFDELDKAPGWSWKLWVPMNREQTKILENAIEEIFHDYEHLDAVGELLSLLRTAKHGYTPLMRAAAYGKTELTQLLTKIGAVGFEKSGLMNWMVDPTAQINARALALHMTKDEIEKPACIKDDYDIVPLSSYLDEFNTHNFGRYGLELLCLARCLDALCLSAIGGHIETVNALISYFEFNKIRIDAYSVIKDTLHKLNAASSAVQSKHANILFQNMGIQNKPNSNNYEPIARNLIACFKRLIPSKPKPANDSVARFTLGNDIQFLLVRTLLGGSCSMLQVMAEEFGMIPAESQWFEKRRNKEIDLVERHVESLANGEKLGILLSVQAHPNSVVYQLAMGMLSHAEKNPQMLARLKEYVRKSRMVSAHIRSHLLPVLAPKVAEYASHCMPTEIADYILNLQPEQEEDDDNEGNLLGQHMTSIMTRRRQLNGAQRD